MGATKAQMQAWLDDCVWVSPGRAFGDACVGGTATTTFQVALAVARGEHAALRMTRAQILTACAFIVMWRPRRWVPRRWGRMAGAWEAWLDDNYRALWHGQYDKVPFPPRVAI